MVLGHQPVGWLACDWATAPVQKGRRSLNPDLTEKTMSKTNDDTTKTRELTEAELAAVSGGIKDFAGTYAPFAGDGLGSAHSLMGGYKTAQSEGYGN